MLTPSVRSPAVAGTFYPGTRAELGQVVDDLLREALARVPGTDRPCPKALVVPHAGYVYSGEVAAAAYALLAPFGRSIERVVLLGPAHRVYLEGLASPGADRLRTPLGEIEVDEEALERVPEVRPNREAHAMEHSLEVELPFLQRVAPRAKIVPLVAGRASPAVVGRVLERVWGGAETVVVVSSDLSHYLPYDEGRRADEHTAARIIGLDAPLDPDEACGAVGINGLLHVARSRGMRAELVDLRSSGDTAGPRDRVVGYGAFALYEAGAR